MPGFVVRKAAQIMQQGGYANDKAIRAFLLRYMQSEPVNALDMLPAMSEIVERAETLLRLSIHI